MFEKTLVSTARTIYWVLAGSGAAWLAWMCFAHLSFWLALILFPVAFVLMAMAIWRHKTNIKRLLSGTENKLWGGKKN